MGDYDLYSLILQRLNNTQYNWNAGILEGENVVDYNSFQEYTNEIAELESKAQQV